MVTVDSGMTVHTRRGRDIAMCLPELAGLAEVLGGHEVILDGELIAGDGRACDFYRVAPRLTASDRRARQPLHLANFDLLWLDGHRCRRSYASAICCWKASPCRHTGGRPSLSSTRCRQPACYLRQLGPGRDRCQTTVSLYHQGRRSSDWVKVKTSAWQAQGTRTARGMADMCAISDACT
jgi:bifunctional non-homologous end joining protein LigD